MSKIFKEFLKINNRKTNNSIKKWAKVLNGNLTKEDMQVENKHMEKCSSNVIRELKINTTMVQHYTPIRMAKIHSTNNIECWQGCGGIETLSRSWWDCKMVQLLWKTV